MDFVLLLDIIMQAVHRPDRLVSGLLIFARNASKADLFRQQIEGGLVQKQYIAKVVGEFPENVLEVNVSINYSAREGRSTAEYIRALAVNGRACFVQAGDPTCDTALLKGKAACTKFTRISTNGTHSIVLCEPVTGRTHQTRVHLQFSGHPIANDMLYLLEQRTNRSDEGMVADKAAGLSLESSVPDIGQNHKEEDPCIEFISDPVCTNCPNLAPKGYDGSEEGLWLHCIRYSGPGWVCECPYPDRASLS